MTQGEKRLISQLLYMVSEEYSNHTCNDIDESFFEYIGLKERREMARDIEEWNKTSINYREDCDITHYPDWMIMKYLAWKVLMSI